MNENEKINSNYTQFQKVALLAYLYLKNGGAKCPSEAWDKACNALNVKYSIREKGCPEGAFIGLVEHNCLRGLPKVSSVHTTSKNAQYAVILAGLYKSGSILNFGTKKSKWDFFREQAANVGLDDVAENYNGQLDIVEVFYEEKLLK